MSGFRAEIYRNRFLLLYAGVTILCGLMAVSAWFILEPLEQDNVPAATVTKIIEPMPTQVLKRVTYEIIGSKRDHFVEINYRRSRERIYPWDDLWGRGGLWSKTTWVIVDHWTDDVFVYAYYSDNYTNDHGETGLTCRILIDGVEVDREVGKFGYGPSCRFRIGKLLED